ncbi:MAG TPA: TolC family protein, partial [Aquifex aeolicus]|nr:TolC family protein [Aquifex aeolicus]
GYSFGLRMSMTLLDSGRTSARFMQERIEEVKSKRELSFTRVKVLSEVDTLKLQLRSALEEVKARRESLRAAEESLRYATERYREGVGSQVELLEARRAYEEAKLSYLNAIYLYNSVVADLKYFLGWHTKKTVEQQLGDSTGSKPMDFE